MQKWMRWLVAAFLLGGPLYGGAEENEKALAHASLNFLKVNHFAEHIAAPFENDFNFGYGPSDNAQSILNFKPVLPFRLTPAYDLIIRTIAPLYARTATLNQQNIIAGHYINGWGDFNPTFFVSPSHFHIFCLGLGPTLFMPTSSNSKNIGSGKWSLGPEFAVVAIPGNWMFGFLTYNVWSIAGEENRPAVAQFSFQYLISYVFESGWYISSNPNITANWKKPAFHTASVFRIRSTSLFSSGELASPTCSANPIFLDKAYSKAAPVSCRGAR